MSKLRARLKRTGPGRRLSAAREHAARRELLLKSGVFDQAWYSGLAARSFDTETAAIDHYLTTGWRRRWTASPLLDPSYFLPGHDTSAGVDPLTAYLRGWRGDRNPHRVFDQAAYRAQHPDCTGHPGGALGHFIANAGPDSPLPVPSGYPFPAPAWGPWRAAMLDFARERGRNRELRDRRVQRHWDRAADAAYVSQWSAAPLPPTSAGEPLVSVIMPVRNRPGLVRTAIASARAQTLTSWELIVIDDGSTDDTADAVREEAGGDARVRLIRQEPAGAAAARNRGVEAAGGHYLAFLDSDDTWVPHFLHVAVAALAASRGDGIRAAHAAVELRGPKGVRFRAYDGDRSGLAVANAIALCGLIAERDLVVRAGSFDPAIRRWMDYDLILRLARHTEIPLLPFVGAVVDEAPERADRISDTESDGWELAVLGRHLIDWEQLRAGADQRVTGRTSILIPAFEDWRMTVRAVAAALDTTRDLDVEIVVISNGSGLMFAAGLVAQLSTLERVKLVISPRNRMFALGSNLAFAASTGSNVVFLNNDTEARDGWLPPLLEQLRNPAVRGVQPLLLYPDGTVQTAGTVFPPGRALPGHLLANHPADDALRLGCLDLNAVTAAALAMRASEFAELEGFDPLYVNGWEDVDLCLRAIDTFGGRFRTEVASRVVHHEGKSPGRGLRMLDNRRLFSQRWGDRLPQGTDRWWQRLGFSVPHWVPGTDPAPGVLRTMTPMLIRQPALVSEGPGVGLPSLRWALKLAAPAGPDGERWGDAHFAAALARSLRRLGQDAVIDPRQSCERATSYLDDVVLVIRGLDRVEPEPGRVNLLWIISHPELVTDEELRSFDAVFAASQPWAAQATQRSGVSVTSLLQATDPARFHPGAAAADSGEEVLFVGNTREADRPIVRFALAAGLPLAVYGAGWAERIPAGNWRAPYLDNDQLPAAYRGAGVVLCDHWDDMAAAGFISNRIFDAVAAGARVVSDPVAGIEEVFGPAVQVVHGPDDLAKIAADPDAWFPSERERRQIVQEIATGHSFDRRASVLLKAAVTVHERIRATA